MEHANDVDRRRHLRVRVNGQVDLLVEGRPLTATCHEFGIGGMFASADDQLAEGASLTALRLRCAGSEFPLNATARIVWLRPGPTPTHNMGLEFIADDPQAEAALDAALSSILAYSASSPRLTERDPPRSGPYYRDEQQLLHVCCTLLAKVGLAHYWSEEGPSAEAKDLLRRNGLDLERSSRTMLLTVWRLWNGNATAAVSVAQSSLPPELAIPLLELRQALDQSIKALDDWLARHEDAEPPAS